MKFYGIQKTTLIDFPGEVAATIFTAGCNLRCPYCHNPELINNIEQLEAIDWQDIYVFLQKRKNVLGGVCITGGEPLLHDKIAEVINDIHSLGLKVKVDTNGTFPGKLADLNVDFIAMDIKTSLDKYSLLGYQGKSDIKKLINKSLEYILNSGTDYEFRTTVVPEIVTIKDIEKIIPLIKGAKKYTLAQFRPGNTLAEDFKTIHPYPLDVLEKMKDLVESHNIPCEIRANYSS